MTAVFCMRWFGALQSAQWCGCVYSHSLVRRSGEKGITWCSEEGGVVIVVCTMAMHTSKRGLFFGATVRCCRPRCLYAHEFGQTQVVVLCCVFFFWLKEYKSLLVDDVSHLDCHSPNPSHHPRTYTVVHFTCVRAFYVGGLHRKSSSVVAGPAQAATVERWEEEAEEGGCSQLSSYRECVIRDTFQAYSSRPNPPLPPSRPPASLPGPLHPCPNSTAHLSLNPPPRRPFLQHICHLTRPSRP